jgi:hypothetical protein
LIAAERPGLEARLGDIEMTIPRSTMQQGSGVSRHSGHFQLRAWLIAEGLS